MCDDRGRSSGWSGIACTSPVGHLQIAIHVYKCSNSIITTTRPFVLEVISICALVKCGEMCVCAKGILVISMCGRHSRDCRNVCWMSFFCLVLSSNIKKGSMRECVYACVWWVLKRTVDMWKFPFVFMKTWKYLLQRSKKKTLKYPLKKNTYIPTRTSKYICINAGIGNLIKLQKCVYRMGRG